MRSKKLLAVVCSLSVLTGCFFNASVFTAQEYAAEEDSSQTGPEAASGCEERQMEKKPGEVGGNGTQNDPGLPADIPIPEMPGAPAPGPDTSEAPPLPQDLRTSGPAAEEEKREGGPTDTAPEPEAGTGEEVKEGTATGIKIEEMPGLGTASETETSDVPGPDTASETGTGDVPGTGTAPEEGTELPETEAEEVPGVDTAPEEGTEEVPGTDMEQVTAEALTAGPEVHPGEKAGGQAEQMSQIGGAGICDQAIGENAGSRIPDDREKWRGKGACPDKSEGQPSYGSIRAGTSVSWFVQVEKKYGIISACSPGIIREAMDDTSRAVGKAGGGTLVFILEEQGDWDFVESGKARGFLKKEEVESGDDVKKAVCLNGEDNYPVGIALCDPYDNAAFTHTFTTVQQICSSGQEAIMTENGRIHEFPDERSRPVGRAGTGDLLHVLIAASPGWYFIESADVRGYVWYEDLVTGDLADRILADEAGRPIPEAQSAIDPGENRSAYFTLKSSNIPAYHSTEVSGSSAGGDRHYTKEQFDLICAIVAQEDNGSYEGALAVISSAANRCTSPVWCSLGGDILSQLTSPGQYCYSLDHYWERYLNGNVPGYVKQAVMDCIENGVVNHRYTSFRSTRGKTTGTDPEKIGGNWYFGG